MERTDLKGRTFCGFVLELVRTELSFEEMKIFTNMQVGMILDGVEGNLKQRKQAGELRRYGVGEGFDQLEWVVEP